MDVDDCLMREYEGDDERSSIQNKSQHYCDDERRQRTIIKTDDFGKSSTAPDASL